MSTVSNNYGTPALWEQIETLMNQHTYMEGVERTVERVAATGEIFTPTKLVIKLLSQQPLDAFAPSMTVLDPACGDGQFLLAAKLIKTLHYKMNETAALNELYGVDIMRDNVSLTLKRLGGGNIILGDTMKPTQKLDGQTTKEHTLMLEWFN